MRTLIRSSVQPGHGGRRLALVWVEPAFFAWLPGPRARTHGRQSKEVRSIEALKHPGRAAVHLPGEVEGSDLGRDTVRRHGLRLRTPRRSSRTPVRWPRGPMGRQAGTCLGAVETTAWRQRGQPGSVVKCNVYCTWSRHSPRSTRSTPATLRGTRPRRIFISSPRWPGPFDIEIDCVGVRRDD